MLRPAAARARYPAMPPWSGPGRHRTVACRAEMLRRHCGDSGGQDSCCAHRKGAAAMNQTPAHGPENESPEEIPDGPRHREGECKPHLIDCLKCKADGIAKQAEYNAATTPDLEAAQASYNST